MNDKRHETGLEDQYFLENQTDGSKTAVEGEMKVGREPGCELVLACDKSSRVHAELSVDDEGLWVEDRQSTNGTFVNNGQISERTRLDDGDVVQFGDSRFRVVAPAQPAPEADGMKTVVASKDSLLRMLGDEEKSGSAAAEEAEAARPGKAKKAKKAKTSQKKKKSSKPAESTPADQSPDADGAPAPSGQPRARSESAKPAGPKEPESVSEPEEQEVAPGRPGAGDNPSIPRSWADADQLEQRSHTAVFVRGSEDASDTGSGALHPLKAIAQARLNTPADLAILVGLTEPVRGTLFKLSRQGDTGKWEIGRGADADINIEDESVSGRHAQLIHERGRWKIVNMMSVNGTFVNGRKVLSAYLNARDVVRAGGVELVFDARIKKSGSRSRTKEKSTGARSGAGKLLTAPMRWASRLWARLLSVFAGKGEHA
ncbi:MAG: FHA domain-containing protein [Gammaproteobacteria bacterium]|nr:FHA domain-containing protein [Gammaproteobacteria bacterium]